MGLDINTYTVDDLNYLTDNQVCELFEQLQSYPDYKQHPLFKPICARIIVAAFPKAPYN
jgi:hypothetical protein